MKSVSIYLLVLLVFQTSKALGGDCPVYDEAAAVSDDSTRSCKRACTDAVNCTAVKKECLCDDLCGYSCYNPDADCPYLNGTLVNGTITTRKGRTYGNVARHTCVNSYYLDGVSERICRSTRAWSHTAPTCKQGCPRPGPSSTSFADIDLNSVGFKVGTIISHMCRTGYHTTELNMDMTTACLNTFQWNAKQFVCVKQFCGHPGTITNGDLERDSFEFGDSVTYVCDPGYLMVGSAVRRCYAGPEWTPNEGLPVCEPLTCPAPPVLENGKVDDKFPVDRKFKDVIVYSCDAGYKLNGSDTGRCNEEGNWGLAPTCVLDMDCDFEDFSKPTCSYTIESGSFRRTQVTQSNGFLGFSLIGNGVLKSPALTLDGDNATCIRFKFKTPNADNLKAFAINSAGVSKLLYSAPASTVWSTDIFSLKKINFEDSEVFLEFRAESTAEIDSILQVIDPECGTTTGTPATTGIIGSTTTQMYSDYWKSLSEGTTTGTPATTGIIGSTTTQMFSDYWKSLSEGEKIAWFVGPILAFIVLCCIIFYSFYIKKPYPRPPTTPPGRNSDVQLETLALRDSQNSFKQAFSGLA